MKQKKSDALYLSYCGLIINTGRSKGYIEPYDCMEIDVDEQVDPQFHVLKQYLPMQMLDEYQAKLTDEPII